jgi:membrane fusion protein (multidrug efflux system)
MKLFLKIFLMIALLSSAGWYYTHRMKAPAAGNPAAAGGGKTGGGMPVGAVPVQTQDINVTIDTVGTLLASESAEIRAEIAGTVKTVNFTEGQPVKKDDSLVEIDDSLIRADLMKAEAAYNVRQSAFTRNDKLKSSGYVSSQDWEQIRGSLEEAKADIESTRIRLDKTKVRAPFDGQAGLRSFSVGDYVKVGDLLTTLDAVDPVKITFTMPEKNYGDIKPGQKISFFVDAWPSESFSGDIYAISPHINQDTRNFEVKAAIPNGEGRLRPGMFARVGIVTAVHEGARVIPEQAIVPKGDDSFVFVVRDGKAVLQKISIGLRQKGSVEVTSGLTAGETVVTEGIMKIQDGAPVMVMGQKPEAAAGAGAKPDADKKPGGTAPTMAPFAGAKP